jgi:hypothetical protein
MQRLAHSLLIEGMPANGGRGSVDRHGLRTAQFCELCGVHRDQLGDEAIAPFRECPSCGRAACPNCWNLVSDACLHCVRFSLPLTDPPPPAVVPLEEPGVAAAAIASGTAAKKRRRGKKGSVVGAAVLPAAAVTAPPVTPARPATKPDARQAPAAPAERVVEWPNHPVEWPVLLSPAAADAAWAEPDATPDPIKVAAPIVRRPIGRPGRPGRAGVAGVFVVVIAMFGVAGISLAALGGLPGRGVAPAATTPADVPGPQGPTIVDQRVSDPATGTPVQHDPTRGPDDRGGGGASGRSDPSNPDPGGGPSNPGPGSTPKPTSGATAAPTAGTTATPTPDPTPDPTPEPTPEPTPDPTPEPTPEPTPDPTPEP